MNADTRLIEMQETIDKLLFWQAELERRLALQVVPGKIKKGDPKKGYVVDIGFDTHEIPDGGHAGGGADHAPFKEGQQVTLLCPGGDLANAFVIPGGFHEDNPRLSDSADEDIRAARGEKDKRKQLRTTKDEAALENHEAKTFVRAGKDAAEIAHENSAARAKSGGVLHLEASSLTNLKIVVGGATYTIKPEALQPA